MLKPVLQHALDEHVAILDFVVPKEGNFEPWFVRAGESDYREVRQDGRFMKQSVTLRIVPLIYLPADHFSDISMREAYEKLWNPEVVALPEIIRFGNCLWGDYYYEIILRRDGRRLISDISSLQNSETREQIIKEFASIFSSTMAAMQELVSTNQVAADKVKRWCARDYFIDRINKWLEAARGNMAVGRGFISSRDLNESLERLLCNSFVSGMQMEMSFNVFGNTDIIRTRSGRYVLVNGDFAVKPVGYAIAAFAWNLLMHMWQYDKDSALEVIKKLIKNSDMVRSHMIERCLAALLVDLPNKRSPYETLSDWDVKQSTENFRHVLDFLLHEFA